MTESNFSAALLLLLASVACSQAWDFGLRSRPLGLKEAESQLLARSRGLKNEEVSDTEALRAFLPDRVWPASALCLHISSQ